MTATALVDEKAPAYSVSGLTGSVAASRWCGATASGAPTTGAHLVGDWIVAQNGHIWVCTVAGTPGTWVDVGGSGGTPATTVQTENGLDAGQVGTSTNFAREDHRHPITNLVDTSSTQTVGGFKTYTGAHTLQGGNQAQTAYGALPGLVSESLTNATAATSTNVVQTPGAIQFFGTYWTGAASGNWSTAISSTADSAAGKTRLIFTADTTATTGDLLVPSGKSLTTGTRSVITGSRTTTTNASDTVDLGTFASTGGAIELRIHAHLAAPAAGTTASVTKVYEIAVSATMGTLNTWYKVLPVDLSANQATSNDFALEVRRTAAGTFEFRFRQVSIGIAGAITFTVETLGDTAVTYTASTTVTAAPAAVTTLHPSNSMVTAAGNVGVGTDAPGAPFEVVAETVTTQGNTGGDGIHLHARTAADATNTLVAAPRLVWRSQYWNGTASVQSGPSFIAHTVTTTGGLQKLVYSSSIHEFQGDPQVNDGTNTRSLPRGRMVFSGANNTATGTITTTETAGGGLTDVAFTAVSGRKYRIYYSYVVASSVANDPMITRIRNGGGSAPTNASAVLAATPVAGAATAAKPVRVSGFVDVDCVASGAVAPAQINAGAVHIGAFLARDGGTGTLTIGSATAGVLSEISIDDVTA